MSSSCGDESSVDSDAILVPGTDEELLMFHSGFLHTDTVVRHFLRFLST